MENYFSLDASLAKIDVIDARTAKIERMLESITKQPVKEELPTNIGSEAARKLLSDILGCPISKSKFTKDVMNGKIPTRGKAGKWLIFDRNELVHYTESVISKPGNPVFDAVTKAANRKRP